MGADQLHHRGLLLSRQDGEGDLDGAGIPGGGDAGDGDGSGAHLHVVRVVQGILLIQGQKRLVHPNGDVGTDLASGIGKFGFVQGDILRLQFYENGFLGMGGQGQGRQGQHQHQRHGHGALERVSVHGE